MQAPNYRWACHRCQAANEPGTSQCSSCGFTAHPTGEELSPARGIPSQRPPREEDQGELASTVLLLFPEGILGVFVLVTSPVLLFRLIAGAKYVDAVFFLLATTAGATLLYFAGRAHSKWLAYAASLLLIVAGWSYCVS